MYNIVCARMLSEVCALYVMCVRGTVHIWGFMLPCSSTSSLMVTQPHRFQHEKTDENGQKWIMPEEGADDVNVTTKKKYIVKNSQWNYAGYDHKMDFEDPFLNGITKGMKKKYDEERWELEQRMKTFRHKEDTWYMIVQGKKNGKTQVAMYQDKEEFEAKRDEPFKVILGVQHWSYKGVSFDNLQDAKEYVQMARDEEGQEYNWPSTIIVNWKKGKFTATDNDQWAKNVEEEPSESEGEEKNVEEEPSEGPYCGFTLCE